METNLQVGAWMWHTNAMCVVRVTGIGEQCERIDGAKDQMVSVSFSSFQHGACTHVHSYADNGLSYETFSSCLIPLEQAPSYVSELLDDWSDALLENVQRAQLALRDFAAKVEQENSLPVCEEFRKLRVGQKVWSKAVNGMPGVVRIAEWTEQDGVWYHVQWAGEFPNTWQRRDSLSTARIL